MTLDTCRRPGCDNDTRDKGDRYGDDNQFAVSTYGAKFCSPKCEHKFDHAKADARDARRSEQEQHTDDRHPGEKGEFL